MATVESRKQKGLELPNQSEKQQFKERSPMEWANRYIGQLLDRLEEIIDLPELAKRDIRSTMHECAKSVHKSALRIAKQEVEHEGNKLPE